MSARAEMKERRAPRPPARGPRTSAAHAEELHDLDEEQLTVLLALRPDLAEPAPRSIDELEARAFSVPSVLRALLHANLSVLEVIQVLAILGEKHACVADVRAMAGEGAELAVTEALTWLEDRHLVARLSDDELCVHPAFLSIVGAAALGPPAVELVGQLTVSDLQGVLGAIGRRAGAGRKTDLVAHLLAFLTDANAVRSLVDGAPADARRLAQDHATGSACLSLPWDAGSFTYRHRAGREKVDPSTWLLRHGLAYRDGWMTAVMPREVGLALRGGRPFPADSYRRPRVEVEPLAEPSPTTVEARVVAVTQAVEQIVEGWGSRPAALLKSGGVGVREVRRLAEAVEMPEHDAFRLVEVAADAGLIVADVRRGSVLPTSAADRWLELGLADRWWVLARSWREMAVPASVAGALDSRRKALPALEYVPDTTSKAAVQRDTVLRLVLELRHGSAESATSLAEAASWDAPLAWSDVVAPVELVVRWALAEMELFGLAVDGAPSALARALIDDDLESARRLLDGAGTEAWELVLQADLTALVTGRVPSRVRAELTLLADVEGRGAATVYRFSECSVRRAFDAGRSGEEILAFLEAYAAKGVPQALTYLVGDVERRHGHMRLGKAACYVRFDDAALAAEVLRAKKLVKFGLRQIAPTVLVSDSPLHAVLSALRGIGYLPVGESGDGAVVPVPVVRERADGGRSMSGVHAARDDLVGDPQVDRWGLGPEAGADAERRRGLAAALAGSRGTASRQVDHRGPEAIRPRSSRVELPTVLRRPRTAGTWTVSTGPAPSRHEPEELFDAPRLDDAELDLLAAELADDFDDDEPLERPSGIVRTPETIFDLLQLAGEEEWCVRISYTSGAGKTFEVTVDVLDVSDRVILAQVAPRWTEQKYLLERIGWARILTEAEEELVR
ncbi:MAG TPA: helicase-associated domain-containing protein [Acidimicrobiales bacterium]|nr:helicase-associated domain-containing protein [Acidimicrobiales bacterium]